MKHKIKPRFFSLEVYEIVQRNILEISVGIVHGLSRTFHRLLMIFRGHSTDFPRTLKLGHINGSSIGTIQRPFSNTPATFHRLFVEAANTILRASSSFS
jgi:hypothetical protein